MHTIYSTMSSDVAYAKFSDGDVPREEFRVVIKGGANVMDKKQIVTPLGVPTQVTDEALAFLENDPVFQGDVKRGFLKVYRGKSRAPEADKAVKDMQAADASAPITPGSAATADLDGVSASAAG